MVLYCHPNMPCFSTAVLTAFPRLSTTCSYVIRERPLFIRLKLGVDSQCMLQVRVSTTVCKVRLPWDALARISLPPNRCNAYVGAVLHDIAVRNPSSIEHCLSSRLFQWPQKNTRSDIATCAPGKSWSFVIVDEYLFSLGFPSKVASSGKCGKSRYLGSSGSSCLCRFDGSMVKESKMLIDSHRDRLERDEH